MPCLSGRYHPGIGPIVNVGVAKPGTLTPTAAAPAVAVPALLDTGATSTCIALSVANVVGPSPIGMRPMVSATHSIPVNVYLADLVMPFGASGFAVSGSQLMEFTPHPAAPFQILVGRDIICQGLLTISFDGHFTFCL